MMKSSDFIQESIGCVKNEDEVVTRVASIITRDCQPFLTQMSSIDIAAHMPLRGTKVPRDDTLTKHWVPTNRLPVDTPKFIHSAADDWFAHMSGGIRYRSNAVFAVGDEVTASNYGIAYRLIPIGEFHYCWSKKVADMTGHISHDAVLTVLRRRWANPHKVMYSPDEDDKKKVVIAIQTLLEDGEYVFDDGLPEVISNPTINHHEVMLFCPSGYYLFGVSDLQRKWTCKNAKLTDQLLWNKVVEKLK